MRQTQAQNQSTALLSTDLNGSVFQAFSPPMTQTISYSAYGYHLQTAAIVSLPAFNGEPPQQMTGLYLLGNGYRAFSPILMRFHSPDSLSPFGRGGINYYSYCGGDPINRIDPSGHMPRFRPILKVTAPSRPPSPEFPGALGGRPLSPPARPATSRPAGASGTVETHVSVRPKKTVTFAPLPAEPISRPNGLKTQSKTPNFSRPGVAKAGVSPEDAERIRKEWQYPELGAAGAIEENQHIGRIRQRVLDGPAQIARLREAGGDEEYDLALKSYYRNRTDIANYEFFNTP